MTPRSGMRSPDALYNVWALALAESSILREYFSIKLWPKRLWLEPVSGVAFAWKAVSALPPCWKNSSLILGVGIEPCLSSSLRLLSHCAAGVRSGAPYALMALLAGNIALVMNECALAAELTMKLWRLDTNESLVAACVMQRGCWDRDGAAGLGLDIGRTGGSSESEWTSLRLE